MGKRKQRPTSTFSPVVECEGSGAYRLSGVAHGPHTIHHQRGHRMHHLPHTRALISLPCTRPLRGFRRRRRWRAQRRKGDSCLQCGILTIVPSNTLSGSSTRLVPAFCKRSVRRTTAGLVGQPAWTAVVSTRSHVAHKTCVGGGELTRGMSHTPVAKEPCVCPHPLSSSSEVGRAWTNNALLGA